MSLVRKPPIRSTWAPASFMALATGRAMAQPRPPPSTATRPVALHVGGGAQRAHKVVEAVPLLQLVQGQGGAPHLLIDHSDLSVLGAGDGQGDTLPRLVHPQDDELARLGFGGDQRCLH